MNKLYLLLLLSVIVFVSYKTDNKETMKYYYLKGYEDAIYDRAETEEDLVKGLDLLDSIEFNIDKNQNFYESISNKKNN